jgi:hypothetical protein
VIGPLCVWVSDGSTSIDTGPATITPTWDLQALGHCVVVTVTGAPWRDEMALIVHHHINVIRRPPKGNVGQYASTHVITKPIRTPKRKVGTIITQHVMFGTSLKIFLYKYI